MLTSIKVFDQQIYTDVTEPVELKLNHNQNNISFTFSLLDYSTVLGKKYIYILEGVDEKWTYTNSNYVRYANLLPGRYTFHIRAETKEGFANINDLYVVVNIDAPLWRKPWFWVSLVVLIVLAVYAALVMRLKQGRLYQAKLKEEVKDKTYGLVQKHEELIEQKKELEVKTGQLMLKTEELEKKTNELEVANNTKNMLVSVIGHDLKNQLNPLINLSYGLMRNASISKNPKLRLHTQLMHEASNSLSQVLNNLLYWYRHQRAALKPELVQVDICDLFNGVAKLYELAAEQNGITIEQSFEEGMFVVGDHEMLKTIVRNLLNNAVKFTHQGGTITLQASEDKQSYIIQVEDTGYGMDEEHLKQLFLFEQNKQTKTKGSGTGLGLQICKQLTEAMGGELSVSSELRKGSCFTITWPKSIL